MDPITPHDKQKLEKFANNANHLKEFSYLNTRNLTATNYHEEKEKFFASNTYNPHFSYEPPKEFDSQKALTALRNELTTITLPEDFRLYLEHYITNLEQIDKARLAIGTEKFATYAKQAFTLDNPKLQKYLDQSPEITITPEIKTELYNAEQIAEIFRNTLHNTYGIKHYTVSIDNFNDHTIRVGDKKVILGSKVLRYRKSVERLINHEIESHVLQRINAERNPLMTLMTPSDRTLYGEGLAVYNEVACKKITLKMYKLYSLRLKAVRLLNLSFREIFDNISGGLPDKLAYQITYRVKRGLGDTTQQGGYPKDAFYLLGYMVVKDFVDTGNDIRILYHARTPDLYTFATKYNFLPKDDVILPTFLASTNPSQ